MKADAKGGKRAFGASFKAVELEAYFNWPGGRVSGEWWRKLKAHVRAYPRGMQRSWGIPFKMAGDGGRCVVLVRKGSPEVRVELGGTANFLCLLHEWRQLPESVRREEPREGLVVGEYILDFDDGTEHVQPVRARFEVAMEESPGPVWLARPLRMPAAVDPAGYPQGMQWGGHRQASSGEEGSLSCMPCRIHTPASAYGHLSFGGFMTPRCWWPG